MLICFVFTFEMTDWSPTADTVLLEAYEESRPVAPSEGATLIVGSNPRFG